MVRPDETDAPCLAVADEEQEGMVGNEAWNSRGGYMIRPEDYGTYELETYLVNDMTFFYTPTGDRVGYEAFPAGPSPAPIEFRGDSIREGFRRVSE